MQDSCGGETDEEVDLYFLKYDRGAGGIRQR